MAKDIHRYRDEMEAPTGPSCYMEYTLMGYSSQPDSRPGRQAGEHKAELWII